MSSKILISFFVLVGIGLSFIPPTEGSLVVHPYYRFRPSFWPELDLFNEQFFSDPFFHDSHDWDPFGDEEFFFDRDFPIFRKPATGQQKHCLSKPASEKAPEKPSSEGFKLSVNVEGFAARDMRLMTQGNDVIVKGEKNVCDFTSCYTRTFCWRKKLPRDVKINTVTAKLTKDNILEITAQKKKEIEGEWDTTFRERTTREKSTKVQNNLGTEAQVEQRMPDRPMNSQQPIKKSFTKEQATKEEVEEETTLEVVNDDEQL